MQCSAKCLKIGPYAERHFAECRGALSHVLRSFFVLGCHIGKTPASKP